MSHDDLIKEATELYDVLDLRVVRLMAQGLTDEHPDRVMAERLRNNLAACVTLGKTNASAAAMLLPNVIQSVKEYLTSLDASQTPQN